MQEIVVVEVMEAFNRPFGLTDLPLPENEGSREGTKPFVES